MQKKNVVYWKKNSNLIILYFIWPYPQISCCSSLPCIFFFVFVTNTMLLFSHSVVSNSLLPHGLQHSRPPCPSLSPRACSNSCSLNQWFQPTISSSVVPFSSHLQSSPASGSFPMSWLFVSGDPSIAASVSVLPMSIQGSLPLRLIALISLLSKGLFSLIQCHNSKASILQCSAFFMVQFSLLCIYIIFHLSLLHNITSLRARF